MTIWQLIRSDFRAIFERDPAATNRFEVALTYTAFHAVLLYRLAHALVAFGIPVLPRLISTIARFLSGVEIHPAAQIGPRFVIDHGTGVVIGETTEIGDNCLLFQGVTLGGTGKEHKKRHPTLGDHVVVGAGAKILGSMRIGSYTKIGSNAVVLSPVPDHCTVVGVPGRIARIKGELPEEGMDHIHMPDPIAERFRALEERVADLCRGAGLADPGIEEESVGAADDNVQPTATAAADTTAVQRQLSRLAGQVADLQAAVAAGQAKATMAEGMAREVKELYRQVQAASPKTHTAAHPKPRASLTRKRRAATRKPGG
jgi:serine O-acetyltransferase